MGCAFAEGDGPPPLLAVLKNPALFERSSRNSTRVIKGSNKWYSYVRVTSFNVSFVSVAAKGLFGYIRSNATNGNELPSVYKNG